MIPTQFRTTSAWCICVAICAVLLCSPNFSVAEQTEDTLEDLAEQTEAANHALGDKRFFAMPIPIHNPTIGTGLGLSTMYLFDYAQGKDSGVWYFRIGEVF